MSTKKKLITRMALWTGAVLAFALLVLGGAFLRIHGDRQRFEHEQQRKRAEAVESSRKYLGELAERIEKLPVDPTIVGEIESRYFEEQASGPMHVWAMATSGEFLFGVPREAFSRLNSIYDRDVTPRLKEGVFLDRQTFLRNLVDQVDEIDPKEFGPEAADRQSGVWSDWRLRRRDESSFVLSTPLKTAEGTALGSLYLKRARGEREYYRPDERLEFVAGAAGVLAGLSFVFLWILLPTWVYVDARERGARRAPLFAFLTAISSLVGLVVYLIARPEHGKTLACPGCGREVDGGAFCPHCGRDLSASFCPACRYPLKPEWAFCPSCRTEIKPPSETAVEAPSAGQPRPSDS
jgi:hypothetical protein